MVALWITESKGCLQVAIPTISGMIKNTLLEIIGLVSTEVKSVISKGSGKPQHYSSGQVKVWVIAGFQCRAPSSEPYGSGLPVDLNVKKTSGSTGCASN